MSADLYKYFMIEAAEILDELNRDILEFENNQTDTKLLNSLFRYAHTLKGAAHVVGLLNIGKLAHAVEDLFSKARDDKKKLGTHEISLIIETIDIIAKIIEEVKKGEPEDFISIDEIFVKFEAVEAANTDGGSNLEAEHLEIHQEAQRQNLQNKEEKIEAAPKDTDKLKESNISSPDQKVKNQFSGDTLRVAILDIDNLMNQASEFIIGTMKLEQLHTNFKKHAVLCGNMISNYKEMLSCLENVEDSGSIKRGALDKIKKLSVKTDLAGQHLIMNKNITLLDTTTEELKQISESMYNVIHKIRSERVSGISHYFKGAVRDLSLKLNKKINILIKGDEIELDRNLIEELKEPVNQIIRNAAVHGLEQEEERVALGKGAEGQIIIDFKKRGDFVYITCEDDGRGISAEKIRRIALEKGIIDKKKTKELSDNDALYLIFASGFSSGAIITEFAGRGVGLDIVKEKVDSLRGSIDMETMENRYTRFIIKLPLSLNMIDAFLVESSGSKYFFPLNMVQRTGYILKKEIEFIAGRGAVMIDGLPVSLSSLSDILGLEKSKSSNDEEFPCVLLKSGHETAAFAVDRILGVQRIIIKKLGGRLGEVKHFIGGAILSGGEPALVLNCPELFKSFMGRASFFAVESPEEKEAVKPAAGILCVDDSLTSRVLISGLLESAGYDVAMASSGEEAMEIINKEKFDLIISDVEMPGINGFELAEKIRKDEINKDTPIIIVSSLSKDEHRRRGIEVGAQAYIVKGAFDQGVFLETIERLV